VICSFFLLRRVETGFLFLQVSICSPRFRWCIVRNKLSTYPPSSNRTCGFPAYGFPINFISSFHKCQPINAYFITSCIPKWFTTVIRILTIKPAFTLTFPFTPCLAFRYNFRWKIRTLSSSLKFLLVSADIVFRVFPNSTILFSLEIRLK